MAAISEQQGEPAAGAAFSRMAAIWPFRREWFVLWPLLLFLAIFAWLIGLNVVRFAGPSGAAYGSDFAVFYEASQVLGRGGDPYDSNLLWHSERADFARAGVQIPHDKMLVRVGNPPLLFFALRPLAMFPFRVAGTVWTIAMYLSSLAGFILLLRWLGWRRYFAPAAIFLAMPQVILGAFYGDIIGFIFAVVACSNVVARRYPVLAGFALSICWLKPHVALPAVLLVWAFHTDARGKLFLGFVGGSVLQWAATFAVVGPEGVRHWVAGLFGWAHSIAGQPEITSLAGLYYLWAPSLWRICLSALLLAGALAVTLFTWRGAGPSPVDPLSVAWLWALWLLCVPYAHINDQILLVLPVLAVLGRNGSRINSLPSALTLYLLCFCIFINSIPGLPLNLEPLKLSAVVIILASSQVRSSLLTARQAGRPRPEGQIAR